MTDPRTPPPDDRDPVDPDVALASAHVDGELDDAEQARIAADPTAADLAVRLAAIAHEVRDVPPPPPELVDAHVTAALRAMDEVGPTPDADAAVVAIGRARRAQPWWERVPLGAVAAVLAVVALVGAIGLASQAGDDNTDTAATALDPADEGDDAADGEAEEDTGALEAAPFDNSGGAIGGSTAVRQAYAGYDELTAALQAAPATTADGGDGATEGADRSTEATAEADEADETMADDRASPPLDPCGAVGVLGLAEVDVEQVVAVLVAGEPVTAVVHVVDGERRLSVVDDATCAVSFEQAL